MKKAKTSDKRYLVGIPIPSLDMRGQHLDASEVETWTKKALDELTACFGGATPIPAPGTNVILNAAGQLQTLYEHGQTLVLSACSNRKEFKSKRSRIKRLAEQMARALRQHAVFVLAFPSDSFLVELTESPSSQGQRRRRQL